MPKRPNYKACASTLKGYLCRKYGGYKRDINKQCVGCPASGEVCYMVEIMKDINKKAWRYIKEVEE